MDKPVRILAQCIWYLFKAMIKLLIIIWGHETLAKRQRETQMKHMVRQETQARMNEFLGMISHELRTPLTGLKGNIQLVGKRLKNNQAIEALSREQLEGQFRETQRLLERAEQQISRLTRIVNSLVENARISGNTMDLLFEVCDLNALAREITHRAYALPQTRTISINTPEEKTVLVMADASRIKQVFMQYLSNAHKYSRIERPIKVELTEDEEQVRISIQDEGPGIAPGEQQRIWEQYYRVPGTVILNGSEVGLGIGLYLCKTIVEQHRGKVGVNSAPGKGTTFWFSMPRIEQRLEGYFG